MRKSESLTVEEVLDLMCSHPGLDAVDDEAQRGALISDYLQLAESVTGVSGELLEKVTQVKAKAIRAGMSGRQCDFMALLDAAADLLRKWECIQGRLAALDILEEAGECDADWLRAERRRLRGGMPVLLTDNIVVLHPMEAHG